MQDKYPGRKNHLSSVEEGSNGPKGVQTGTIFSKNPNLVHKIHQGSSLSLNCSLADGRPSSKRNHLEHHDPLLWYKGNDAYDWGDLDGIDYEWCGQGDPEFPAYILINPRTSTRELHPRQRPDRSAMESYGDMKRRLAKKYGRPYGTQADVDAQQAVDSVPEKSAFTDAAVDAEAVGVGKVEKVWSTEKVATDMKATGVGMVETAKNVRMVESDGMVEGIENIEGVEIVEFVKNIEGIENIEGVEIVKSVGMVRKSAKIAKVKGVISEKALVRGQNTAHGSQSVSRRGREWTGMTIMRRRRRQSLLDGEKRTLQRLVKKYRKCSELMINKYRALANKQANATGKVLPSNDEDLFHMLKASRP
ncbi:hypothetical protein NP233_g12905 [Leucocoprinus birnbaumii]|uniref:Uncharacterized protein n=1 Tax=Leucocoprinus birnbaumii TaxID=56174 RepID=A0AAD5VHS5_9AGAR|nr:hypothetical protein NP233_g12905 [Leucocoprinus birnbaumii]